MTVFEVFKDRGTWAFKSVGYKTVARIRSRCMSKCKGGYGEANSLATLLVGKHLGSKRGFEIQQDSEAGALP